VISDNALLDYFYRGLIPGPEESEEAFLHRVKQAKPLAHPEWDEVFYPFKIDWVPLSYSNHQIAWWEGAATWISDDELPSIQLRKNFQKGTFLGYKRSEVLSHEAIHAARMRFDEPLFEEVLAYSTAPQVWKRFFGPLFSRTWEPLVLMVGIGLGIFWPLIPTLMMGLSIAWLSYRQWIFKRCLKRFSFPLVISLTDKEMKKFAWMTPTEIQAYLEKGKTLLFRVRRINYKGLGRS
jgi:hypothetical protein